MEQLDFIRNAGETRRFHTWPVLREQNVAAHSWHVTMLVYLMYGQDEPGIRPVMMMAALTHDMAEWKVGDIPSPAKRTMEDYLQLKGAQTFRQAWGDMEQNILKEQSFDFEGMLTVEELRMLKIADAMEGALYCIRERMMGNVLIVPCYLNFIKYIEQELGERGNDDVPFPGEEKEDPMEWQVYDYITTQWELANGS